MQFKGNIGNDLVPRKNTNTGKTFYSFRCCENNGKGEHKTSTWYDVTANISELEADMLGRGQLVEVHGTLVPEQYNKGDGTPAVALKVRAWSVVPTSFPERRDENSQS
jgi:single-stranded DNA-binding protein